MTKLDKTMTSMFKHIREEHKQTNVDVVQTITRLGKALLNLQQMSSQQAVYIVLSLPLNASSRKCIFNNTSPKDQHAFILKKPIDLQQQPDNSEDIICASIIDYYLQLIATIEHICLAEFASSYTKKLKEVKK